MLWEGRCGSLPTYRIDLQRFTLLRELGGGEQHVIGFVAVHLNGAQLQRVQGGG